MNVQELIDSRDEEYGQAWKRHGQIMQHMSYELHEFLSKHPVVYFPWMMIFNKLLRILASPSKPDHWRDIQGYAQLVLNELTKGKDNG